jgi:hypothetical protein
LAGFPATGDEVLTAEEVLSVTAMNKLLTAVAMNMHMDTQAVMGCGQTASL